MSPPSPAAAPRPGAKASFTVAAMVAFAANSILCRLALAHSSIDPASFTLVRIGAGVVTLWLILGVRRKAGSVAGTWRGAVALFAYAAAFSWAYITLSASTGALLLFGACGDHGRHRAGPRRDADHTAMARLSPRARRLGGPFDPRRFGPAPRRRASHAGGRRSLGRLLWLGRGAADPLAATAGNFLRALPMAAVAFLVASMIGTHQGPEGLLYAALSGAIASGVGYTIWYAALPSLSPVQGASVQLSVPVLRARRDTHFGRGDFGSPRAHVRRDPRGHRPCHCQPTPASLDAASRSAVGRFAVVACPKADVVWRRRIEGRPGGSTQSARLTPASAFAKP